MQAATKTREVKRHVLMTSAWLTAPTWLFPLGWWLAYQPWSLLNYVGMLILGTQVFLIFVALAAAVVLVGGPIAVLLGADRRRAPILIAHAVVFLPSFIGGIILGSMVQHAGIVDVTNRGEPLVIAIQQFTVNNGQPPNSLVELMPLYLTTIPTTGLARFPDFEYIVGKPTVYDGNPWVLHVSPPCVGMSFDSLYYFPLQNYPTVGYGGGIERIGTWGYVHE